MYGFVSETIAGKPGITRAYEAHEWAYSSRRTYWDAQLGDPVGLTEGIRRIIPNRRSAGVEWVNPLANRMPGWIPSGKAGTMDFRHGDPYVKLPQGEMRLPGAAMETLYDIQHTFPVDAEYLGGNRWQSTTCNTAFRGS